VGERRPLVPPMGICHVAWSGEEMIQSYVGKATPHLSEDVRQHLLAAFPLVRRRGYAMAANGPSTGHSRRATVLPVDQIRDAAYWASVFELVGHLSPNEIQLLDAADAGANGISTISAPVFSPSRQVSFQLVITGLPSDLSVHNIERYAQRLCAAAALITSDTHGRRPND